MKFAYLFAVAVIFNFAAMFDGPMRMRIHGDDPLMAVKMKVAHSLSMPATCGPSSTQATLQSCYDAATFGDTVTVTAATVVNMTGSLIVTDRGTSPGTYITITTSNPAGIPSSLSTDYPNSYQGGTFHRVTTAEAANMPKLVQVSNQPVISLKTNAHHVKFIGLEFTNDGLTQLTALVQDDALVRPHHIVFDQDYLHPKEEVGTMTDYANRTVESAFLLSMDDSSITHCAVQGFTGNNKLPTPDEYRLNANSFLTGGANNLVMENNLLEANGQVFISGSGEPDPAHTATCTSWTFTSATCSSTTDLDVGDLIRAYSDGLYNNHLTPNPNNPDVMIPRVTPFANAEITAVNHGTGAITFTHLTSGLAYRQFNLWLYGATGGTFTLSFMGQTTAPIAYNIDSAGLRAAVEALSNVAPTDFALSAGEINGGSWPYADYNIEFGTAQDGTPGGAWAYPAAMNPMTINYSSLTGQAHNPAVAVHSAESYTPLENSQDGTLIDIPLAGAEINWEGFQATNILIRRNIIAHHHEWTVETGTVKGFAEQKGGDHVTWDANIFAGEPTGIVFTVRNQGGATPWINNNFSTLSNNIFEETGGTMIMTLSDGTYQTEESHDIDILNNLALWPGGFVLRTNPTMKLQNGYNVRIKHNTWFSDVWLQGASFAPSTSGTVIQDNIIRPNGYIVPCTDGADPCWPGATVSNNLVWDQKRLGSSFTDSFFSTFGAGAGWLEFPASQATVNAVVKFTSLSTNLDVDGDSNLSLLGGGNYQLDPTSIYAAGNARDATDGKDVGAIIPEIISAMGFNPFVVSPNPVVNAGADQNLSSGTTSTTLTATANDPNSLAMTHSWVRTSGPNTPTIVSPTALSTSVTGMVAGTYVFTETSTNTNAEAGSDSVTVTIASPSPPTAPSSLGATAVSSSQINLTWTDNSSDETGFKLECCSGASCSNFAQVATPAANAVSHPYTGLTASTPYSCRIRATNSNGDSSYSNTATATTQASSSVTVCRWSSTCTVP